MTIDERIAAELRRRSPQVDEHLAWDRIQSAAAKRRRGRAFRLVPISVAALGSALMGLILFSSFFSGPDLASDPGSSFLGTWVNSDTDGSIQTMTIGSQDDAVEITVHDVFSSVCSGAPSTMTGTGRLEGKRGLVIPAPVLTCDDGSQPVAMSGPPLEDPLRNLTFTHDPGTDTLTDNIGAIWVRVGGNGPNPEPTVSGMWPQSSLEEVREAQRLADAGDPGYTWQVDPELAAWAKEAGDAEIVTRFLRDELGWEEFQWSVGGHGGSSEETSAGLMWATESVFIRCAPGLTNPLYPDDPAGGNCAPTIDEYRYETVSLRIAQLGLQGPSGLWVVSRWVMLPPSDEPMTHGEESFSQRQIEQMTPPSDAEATALLEAFLQARIDGEGAQEFLSHPADGEIPLLFATTTGASYETSEIELLAGPVWPLGDMEFEVRLFAEGGETVVVQFIEVRRDDTGRLVLVYPSGSVPWQTATTENGMTVAMAELYEFLDGEVTFEVAQPWDGSFAGWEESPTMTTLHLDGTHEERLVVLADPRPIETGCVHGPAPGDAEALARSLMSDPDLEAAEAVAVHIAGIEALQMDVMAATRANLCEDVGVPEVVAGGTATGLEPGQRMRLYLIDYPGGSAQVLAIAIIAPEDRFESVIEAATPIVESFEFHTD